MLENGYLASGSWDQFIKIWNTGTTTPLTTLLASKTARTASEGSLSLKTTTNTITMTATTNPSLCNIFFFCTKLSSLQIQFSKSKYYFFLIESCQGKLSTKV